MLRPFLHLRSLTQGQGWLLIDIMSLFQIHSYTTRIARRLAGSKTRAGERLDVATPNTDPALATFRAPPIYRSESAQKLRKAVADVVRQDRRS
jgi:hypothetical protein